MKLKVPKKVEKIFCDVCDEIKPKKEAEGLKVGAVCASWLKGERHE